MPNYDVQGWAIDKSNFALGGTHCALSGEGAGVAWAFSPVAFGQLGFGPNGVKSSHTANKMDVGEGLVARRVSESVGQTHLLVAETANATVRLLVGFRGLWPEHGAALRLRLVTSPGSPPPAPATRKG